MIDVPCHMFIIIIISRKLVSLLGQFYRAFPKASPRWAQFQQIPHDIFVGRTLSGAYLNFTVAHLKNFLAPWTMQKNNWIGKRKSICKEPLIILYEQWIVFKSSNSPSVTSI